MLQVHFSQDFELGVVFPHEPSGAVVDRLPGTPSKVNLESLVDLGNLPSVVGVPKKNIRLRSVKKGDSILLNDKIFFPEDSGRRGLFLVGEEAVGGGSVSIIFGNFNKIESVVPFGEAPV